MTATDIIILGVNGNCIDTAETIELLQRQGQPLRVRGFLDDDETLHGQAVAGYPVLGPIAIASEFPAASFVCGIGSPRSFGRKPTLVAAAAVPAERWATIVHPAVAVSPSARLGHGTVLLAHCSVGANARIGNHVMVLQNTVISHDAVVGDYSAVATGVCVSGLVEIGANCYLGSHATIRERLRVGPRTLVGMGAVVTADIPCDAVVMGNPARPR